jgi:Na+/glutamate symporter
MTKNARRATFLAVATLANFLVTLIVLIALGALLVLITGALKLQMSSSLPLFVIAFIGAVVLSFFIYGKFLKYVSSRPDLQERFGIKK